ncbi:MAG: hypothetical protein EOO80_15510 [Oxalobacteraceae bacterium]|nr:MAG: hypothetical protein EOO80_15510 [Oxalobacteraceae bacterium]
MLIERDDAHGAGDDVLGQTGAEFDHGASLDVHRDCAKRRSAAAHRADPPAPIVHEHKIMAQKHQPARAA